MKHLTEFSKVASNEEKEIATTLSNEFKSSKTPREIFDVITRQLTTLKQQRIDTSSMKKSVINAVHNKLGFFKPVGTLVDLLEAEQSRLNDRFNLKEAEDPANNIDMESEITNWVSIQSEDQDAHGNGHDNQLTKIDLDWNKLRLALVVYSAINEMTICLM